MKNAGFTIIELLLSIVIIGILAAVLIPNLLDTRSRANDTGAATVGRNVLTAMAAMETSNHSSTGSDARCTYADGVVTVISGSETTTVNAPNPVSGVTCESTTAAFSTSVAYEGGSTNEKTYISSK